MIQSGDFRHRVEIRRSSPTTDTFGQSVDRWSTIAHAWAEVRGMSARESAAAAGRQLRAVATYVVRVRNRRDDPSLNPTPMDRLTLSDGRSLDVVESIDPDGRGVEIKLTCAELVS